MGKLSRKDKEEAKAKDAARGLFNWYRGSEKGLSKRWERRAKEDKERAAKQQAEKKALDKAKQDEEELFEQRKQAHHNDLAKHWENEPAWLTWTDADKPKELKTASKSSTSGRETARLTASERSRNAIVAQKQQTAKETRNLQRLMAQDDPGDPTPTVTGNSSPQNSRPTRKPRCVPRCQDDPWNCDSCKLNLTPEEKRKMEIITKQQWHIESMNKLKAQRRPRAIPQPAT